MLVSPSKICGLVVLIAFVSCWGQAQQKPDLKIGFSLENTKGERWQTDLDEFQTRAQQLGAQTFIRSADGDDDLQFKQVKELLDSGIDALVLLPHDTAKASRIVEAAQAKHVPVISYDRLVPNPHVDLYIGFDLFQVGVLQAQSLTEHAPKGNYILMAGSPLDPNSKVVRAGQMKVLQPLIDRGDIKILADIWIPEWSPAQAYVLVTQALHDLKVPLTAILASNDGTAGGAIQALADNNLSEQSPRHRSGRRPRRRGPPLRRHATHDRLQTAPRHGPRRRRSLRHPGPSRQSGKHHNRPERGASQPKQSYSRRS